MTHSIRLLFCLVCAAFMLSAAPTISMAADTFYFSALPDMPIAPDLREDADTAVHFDQPEGRVIVLQASGQGPENQVKTFYTKTLPALGWTHQQDGRWIRDGEMLTLDIIATRGGTTKVNLLVRPE